MSWDPFSRILPVFSIHTLRKFFPYFICKSPISTPQRPFPFLLCHSASFLSSVEKNMIFGIFWHSITHFGISFMHDHPFHPAPSSPLCRKRHTYLIISLDIRIPTDIETSRSRAKNGMRLWDGWIARWQKHSRHPFHFYHKNNSNPHRVICYPFSISFWTELNWIETIKYIFFDRTEHSMRYLPSSIWNSQGKSFCESYSNIRVVFYGNCVQWKV